MHDGDELDGSVPSTTDDKYSASVCPISFSHWQRHIVLLLRKAPVISYDVGVYLLKLPALQKTVDPVATIDHEVAGSGGISSDVTCGGVHAEYQLHWISFAALKTSVAKMLGALHREL